MAGSCKDDRVELNYAEKKLLKGSWIKYIYELKLRTRPLSQILMNSLIFLKIDVQLLRFASCK